MQENIAFPLQMRRVPAAEIASEVKRVLDIVRLPQVAGRLPRELSGGQQQRIALARCMVYRPSIILMDEPLGALDRQLRDQMQLEIKDLHARLGITVLYVTHDQEEAMAMSDRICLMNNAHIEQIGTPQELYFRPQSVFVAQFLGESNILDATVKEAGDTLRLAGPDGLEIRARGAAESPREGVVKVLVRPERLRLLSQGESADNVATGTLKETVFAGGATRYFVALPGGVVLSAKQLSPGGLAEPRVGDAVRLGWERRARAGPAAGSARPMTAAQSMSARPPLGQAALIRAWPIYPLLLLILALFVYPVAQILVLSVFDPSGALSTANYARIAKTSVYLQTLVITFKIAGWTTLLALLAGYPVAYLLANSSTRTRDTLTLLVLMPFWTSFLVRTFAWMILLGRNGAVNRLLIALGITDAPVSLIYNFTGVMIGMVHAMMPLGIMAMLSVMQSIDTNLVKAARTLGARGGQAFWRIYFRLSLPGLAAAGLLVFITALGFFITPALLGGRRETMISQIIISVVQELMNWRFAGALSVVLLAAAGVVFYLYDRLLGMSTLSGGAAASDLVGHRGGLIARGGAVVGERIIAGLGWISDRAGDLWDGIFPVRADRPQRGISRGFLWVVGLVLIAFLCLPSLFVIPVSFTSGSFIEFPPEGFSLRWYHTYLSSPGWVDATIRSFIVAFLTAWLSAALGTAAAFVLVRQRLTGRTAILALIMAPLVLPRLIIAVALFYLYARLGLVGTILGLVLGHTILAVPYVVITVMAVLKTYDERLDQAAWSLGASKWRTLYHITLPQIRGGVIAGFLFAFITSFDDLTVALFITGGSTSTLPRQMWNDLLLQVNPTLAAVSTVILVFVTSFVVLAEMLRRRAVREDGLRDVDTGPRRPARCARGRRQRRRHRRRGADRRKHPGRGAPRPRPPGEQ